MLSLREHGFRDRSKLLSEEELHGGREELKECFRVGLNTATIRSLDSSTLPNPRLGGRTYLDFLIRVSG